MSRQLTSEENRILEMIRSYYGPQNSAESITWMPDDEAVLWVTDTAGVIGLMVHLTNLAAWRLDIRPATSHSISSLTAPMRRRCQQPAAHGAAARGARYRRCAR